MLSFSRDRNFRKESVPFFHQGISLQRNISCGGRLGFELPSQRQRPLFYRSSHGASGEEASHYIRFGLKYRVWDNMYLHTSAKTHLHICEFVEFGLGYQIPFLKKKNRSKDNDRIFHHHKNWWKEY